MNKTYRYRLYPTPEQAVLFAKTFGCCRKIYNLMLADKIASYQTTGKFIQTTPAQYKKAYPYLKEVDCQALCNKQLDLEAAFRNCFSKTRKKKCGFPKFKSAKRSRRSYKTNNNKGTIALLDNQIKLPKVGKVAAIIHRLPPADWILKSATISQESDGSYYAAVLFYYEKTIISVPVSNNAIGLDYASNGLYVDDQGHLGSHHKYYRESQRKLAKAQKALSRKIGFRKGEVPSNQYKKQLLRVNRIHRHIANQRKDFLHKRSTEIANQYDVVCVESLNMKAMSNRGFRNGKATMDNGYGIFLNLLEYKLADRGKHFVKIDQWYPSSQICHCCGTLHPEMKDLSIRTMQCDCGLQMDRDQNAAINIKEEGLRMLLQNNAA